MALSLILMIVSVENQFHYSTIQTIQRNPDFYCSHSTVLFLMCVGVCKKDITQLWIVNTSNKVSQYGECVMTFFFFIFSLRDSLTMMYGFSGLNGYTKVKREVKCRTVSKLIFPTPCVLQWMLFLSKVNSN